ncbi:(R)-mandelonitrile lyase [Marinobacterium sp. YM272]|uniref:(R)-mandelonitrile lyase n=1 Tax=Marinobacterium sp. YM272 TaxID=3421654 RepID=UPI003D7F7AC4
MQLERRHLNLIAIAITGWGYSLGALAGDTQPESQTHYPLGSQQSFTGPENLFSGDVQVDILFPANETAHFSGAYVTFAPGAHTAWHNHPAGQHMIVTDGTALTGTRDGKVIDFTEGETVWCPPGIDHWHGATPEAPMTHLVITGSLDGENVNWKEKLTAAEYSNAVIEKTAVFEALSTKQQALIPIAAFTANGDQAALKNAIIKGLDAGLSINEIKEVQVHLYAYTGFPRALNGLVTFMQVLEARKASGIEDEQGQEPGAVAATESSQVVGEQVQTELVGRPVSGPLFDFAPGMNTFLQSHLFGDIFARGVLDYEQRELVTVSALASITGAESQLGSHIQMATNVGVSEAQLTELATVLDISVGKAEGLRVEQAITRILHPENDAG